MSVGPQELPVQYSVNDELPLRAGRQGRGCPYRRFVQWTARVGELHARTHRTSATPDDWRLRACGRCTQILLSRADKDYPAAAPPPLRFIRSCSSSLAPATLHKLEAAFKVPVLEVRNAAPPRRPPGAMRQACLPADQPPPVAAPRSSCELASCWACPRCRTGCGAQVSESRRPRGCASQLNMPAQTSIGHQVGVRYHMHALEAFLLSGQCPVC